jgi:hypothetical protein
MATDTVGQAPRSLSDSGAGKAQFESDRAATAVATKLNHDGRKMQNASVELSATPAESNCSDVEGQAPRSLSARHQG